MSVDAAISILGRNELKIINLAKSNLELIAETIDKEISSEGCKVSFIAYTPSWNDGEECTQCVDFNIPDEFYTEDLWDKLRKLQQYVINAGNIVYDDNYEIIFSSDGYAVTDYECGY